MSIQRLFAVIFSLVAGILLGNTGWVAPAAAVWGGAYNIWACLIFPAMAVVLIMFALILPRDEQ